MAQEQVNAVVMIQVDPTGAIQVIKGDKGPDGRYIALERAKTTLAFIERERVIRRLLEVLPALNEAAIRSAIEPQ